MTNIVTADDSSYAQVLADAKDRTVLVDFHAPWCAPCKTMAPALEAFAKANPDVLVVKVDVDESFDTATAVQVRAVPTLLVLRDGQTVARASGAQTASQLQALVVTTA